jgi:hypothetical protein
MTEGSVSVTVTFVADAGPLLVTASEYVSRVPCVTGLGVAVFTIPTSALLAFATITVALAVLLVRFGTTLVAVAVAVSVMLVPEGVPGLTCRTNVNVPVVLTFIFAPREHVIVPVPPTTGWVAQVHPVGGVID